MSNNKASVFKTSSCTPLRIADVLLLDEEEEGKDGEDLPLLLMDGCRRERREGGCGGRFVSRWLQCFGTTKGHEREEEGDEGADVNVINSSAVTQYDQSGGCKCQRETSFNMGVGCSLLYLLAASKTELDKMMELRIQMEMLLQNFKEELQVRNATEEAMGSNCHRSSQCLSTSYVQPESSTTTIMTYDQSLKWDTPKDVECLEGIDQLQAELEAQLELLQLHLDKEKLLQHPEQQNIEVTVKETAASGSYSMSSGEVIDPETEPQEVFTEVAYGVPPYELERRLHEVLDARQQEHIRELEAALECAKHNLQEKEMEISWWRDTARLISQHLPGPSSRFSERG